MNLLNHLLATKEGHLAVINENRLHFWETSIGTFIQGAVKTDDTAYIFLAQKTQDEAIIWAKHNVPRPPDNNKPAKQAGKSTGRFNW